MFFRRNIGVVSTDRRLSYGNLGRRCMVMGWDRVRNGPRRIGRARRVIAPKEEFEVEEEAKDVYYKALCGSPPPSQDIPIPKRPVRSPNAPLTPSMVSSDYLTTLRDFYQIPCGVVFRIPSGNESANNPPEGFFTCYEAFLVYFRMWFPIPGTIVQALHHFRLSISQLSVPALQHWLGVLISS
ncbi:hypothetical protein F2Q69_00029381 [Brassica cretica]|uniref:Uncharacterized protein n=1 Tax=Brassica cretica TaxID=69181 RepID=A0A8S9S0D6_BRACR|nr:hypothetical protein F2Q69_00029381 [Brassica cretica]